MLMLSLLLLQLLQLTTSKLTNGHKYGEIYTNIHNRHVINKHSINGHGKDSQEDSVNEMNGNKENVPFLKGHNKHGIERHGASFNEMNGNNENVPLVKGQDVNKQGVNVHPDPTIGRIYIYGQKKVFKILRQKRSNTQTGPQIGMIQESECAVDVKGYDCNCYTDSSTQRSNINCRYANLYTVPPFSFVNKVYYEITFSASNFITALQSEAFKNLKVEKIDLLENHLKSVQTGAFDGLEDYLQELLLEGNGKDGLDIPFNVLNKLQKLKRLKLKNFRQDTFSEVNDFGYFPDLEKLELERISLKYISNLAFNGKLTKLLLLQFDEVDFQELPVDSIRYLPSIQRLYIRKTRVSTIYSGSFEKLQNLVDLDLSHNLIEEMQPNTFNGIHNRLTALDLSSNKLKPNSLVALSSKTWNNLRQLTLSYNYDLSLMPGEVFKYMPNLQYLNLDSVNLRHISGDLFLGLGNVQSLSLSWNNIETIQDRSFYNMNKLNELRLGQQFQPDPHERMLEISPEAFTGLENSLVYLDLEKTVLKATQFWNTIRMLKGVKELKIGETQLSEIPQFAFFNNRKLSKLELNGNRITYIHPNAFKGLVDILKEISLHDNNLTTMNECVFKNFSRLDYIHLRRNPLHCDCRLQWLQKFIKIKQGLSPPINENDYICSQPKEYSNRLLTNVSLNCLSYTPEICSDDVPPHPTTSVTINPTIFTTSSATKEYLKMTVASHTKDSITIAWITVTTKPVTGFTLEYKTLTQLGPGLQMKIHKDQITYTLYQLAPGTFYNVCLTAVDNFQAEMSLQDCKIVQTSGQSTNTEGRTDDKPSGENRNIIIAAIIVTVAVVVLITVGVCAVVRYKVLKLREIQFAMRTPVRHQQQTEGDNMVYVCAVPNEYNEIEIARIANKYNIKSPKHMQRQFGIDNFAFDDGQSSSQYNTYQRIDRRKRKNPYENDDEDDDDDVKPPENFPIQKEETQLKKDLELRHSAPSKLGTDKKIEGDRNSRPLPATPSASQQQARSSTLKAVKQGKATLRQETTGTKRTDSPDPGSLNVEKF